MSRLTDQLLKAYGEPVTSAEFDLEAALEEVLAGVGMTVTDCGGCVSHLGADPVLKSPLRIGAASGIALLAKSVAAAAIHRWRGGSGQDIAVDLLRLLVFFLFAQHDTEIEPAIQSVAILRAEDTLLNARHLAEFLLGVGIIALGL
jgi:hypothetical protein